MQEKKLFVFRLVLILVDLAIINIGYILSFILRFQGELPLYNISSYYTTWPLLTISALVLMYFYRLYGSYRWRWMEIFAGILCVVFLQAVFGMAVSYLLGGFSFPRTVFIISPIIQLVLLSIWRRLAWNWERFLLEKRRVVVVGKLEDAGHLADKLEENAGNVIQVIGLLVDNASTDLPAGDRRILGDVDYFCECLDAYHPDQVFVCGSLSQEDKAEVLYACVARETSVFLVPDFYEILITQARLDQVDDVPVFAVGRLQIPPESLIFKRLLDVVFSILGILITQPVLLLAALAIKLDSPGPVLYIQKRMTVQGKLFRLYKLRTMVNNAEAATGPVLSNNGDPRVTRVGRVLRALRIDEIPQLFNVLKGDMSLVGPRPERPIFVDQLMSEVPEYVYRMNVKSGITGLAQIAGKYSTSPENKLKYDLLYTKSYSPARDLAILLQTLKVMLMKDRAT